MDEKDEPTPWLFVFGLLSCGLNVLERVDDRGPWFWVWVIGAVMSAVGLWREVVLPRRRAARAASSGLPSTEPDRSAGEQ